VVFVLMVFVLMIMVLADYRSASAPGVDFVRSFNPAARWHRLRASSTWPVP